MHLAGLTRSTAETVRPKRRCRRRKECSEAQCCRGVWLSGTPAFSAGLRSIGMDSGLTVALCRSSVTWRPCCRARAAPRPPAAADHAIVAARNDPRCYEALGRAGTMAFAASVGEAILLQFQAYARHALVSGDCAHAPQARRPPAQAAPCLHPAPDGPPAAVDRRTRKLLAPTQHAASCWTAWRWVAACGWQRRFSRRSASATAYAASLRNSATAPALPVATCVHGHAAVRNHALFPCPWPGGGAPGGPLPAGAAVQLAAGHAG